MPCIFCRIIKGELPCHRVWENGEFLAILDINPNTEGMTVVLTKKHYPSYAFDLPPAVSRRFFAAAAGVAKLLDRRLGVKRTALAMEGMGVDHAHIKLYPLHGLRKKFKETWAPRRIFFRKYSGYISTQLGPRANDKKLAALAGKLRGKR